MEHLADRGGAAAAGSDEAQPAPPRGRLAQRFHQRPLFVRLLPREVAFDGGMILDALNLSPTGSWRPRLHVDFYPTLILMWTALGLFFGVFLEGFLTGEKLRGEIAGS
jgi:hypothetical protein